MKTIRIRERNVQPVDGAGHFQLRRDVIETNAVATNCPTEVVMATTLRRIRLFSYRTQTPHIHTHAADWSPVKH